MAKVSMASPRKYREIMWRRQRRSGNGASSHHQWRQHRYPRIGSCAWRRNQWHGAASKMKIIMAKMALGIWQRGGYRGGTAAKIIAIKISSLACWRK
jgi:hypothetical protein